MKAAEPQREARVVREGEVWAGVQRGPCICLYEACEGAVGWQRGAVSRLSLRCGKPHGDEQKAEQEHGRCLP